MFPFKKRAEFFLFYMSEWKNQDHRYYKLVLEIIWEYESNMSFMDNDSLAHIHILSMFSSGMSFLLYYPHT